MCGDFIILSNFMKRGLICVFSFTLHKADEVKTEKPTTGLQLSTKPPTPSNHKELIEKIQKEKEEFLAKKKKEEEEKKKAELEKLISSSKKTPADVGLGDGEAPDPITKKRRNFVKKVLLLSVFCIALEYFQMLRIF